MADNNIGLAQPHGTWVQTERQAHEEWAKFLALRGSAAASRVLHLILARMGPGNAYVASQSEMARMLGVDERTIRRGVAMLVEHKWIKAATVGGAKSGVKAYLVNSQVAWQGSRDGLRYSEFDARIRIAESEQEPGIDLTTPPRQLPSMYHGERQLPTGDGLPPPSEPPLPGMEPDLPARHISHQEQE